MKTTCKDCGHDAEYFIHEGGGFLIPEHCENCGSGNRFVRHEKKSCSTCRHDDSYCMKCLPKTLEYWEAKHSDKQVPSEEYQLAVALSELSGKGDVNEAC